MLAIMLWCGLPRCGGRLPVVVALVGSTMDSAEEVAFDVRTGAAGEADRVDGGHRPGGGGGAVADQ